LRVHASYLTTMSVYTALFDAKTKKAEARVTVLKAEDLCLHCIERLRLDSGACNFNQAQTLVTPYQTLTSQMHVHCICISESGTLSALWGESAVDLRSTTHISVYDEHCSWEGDTQDAA